MNNLSKSILLIFSVAQILIPIYAKELSLSGSWRCLPYELETDQYIAVGAEDYLFFEDYTYKEVEYASYFYKQSGEKLVTVVTRHGLWGLENSLLSITQKEATVVSSSNVKVPISQLQDLENEAIKESPERLFQISMTEDLFTYKVLNKNASSAIIEQQYKCERV